MCFNEAATTMPRKIIAARANALKIGGLQWGRGNDAAEDHFALADTEPSCHRFNEAAATMPRKMGVDRLGM
jgi:hypothetical protein